MKNIKKVKFLFLFSICLFCSGCATTIGFRLTRPAELDLNGAKTIAVLPFKPFAYYNSIEAAKGVDVAIRSFFQALDKSGPDEKKAINYIHDYIEEGLMESPYISVVSSESVSRALKEGYINPADVYLTGEVTNYNVYERKTTEKIKIEVDDDDDESKGKRKETYKYVDYFTRYVEFDFRYLIIDSSNDKVINVRKVKIHENSGRYESPRDLPSAYSIIKSELSSTCREVLRELQPYTITKYVDLIEDKSKDKTLHKQMKNAHKLAKDGNNKQAYEEFSRIYDEYKVFEAGYNAALLQEVFGNLSAAEKMMSALYNETKDSRAATALSDIHYEIKQAKRLQSQTEDKELTLD